MTKVYKTHPILANGLGNDWGVRIIRELHRTEASELFQESKGWMVIEGKNFHQFISDYEKPMFRVSKQKGLEYTSTIKAYGGKNKEIHEIERLAFRKVASSTNVRTMIACILPRHVFLTDSAFIILPMFKKKLRLDNEYYRIISYLAGTFNSMTFDFLLKSKVTMNLNQFLVYQTAVPLLKNNLDVNKIIELSAILSCSDDRFEDLAKVIGVKYGAIDIRDRIEKTAELDAMVAHNYSLSRHEYSHILNSFEGFQDCKNFRYSAEIQQSDSFIRKFNGEVRKRALPYFESIKG